MTILFSDPDQLWLISRLSPFGFLCLSCLPLELAIDSSVGRKKCGHCPASPPPLNSFLSFAVSPNIPPFRSLPARRLPSTLQSWSCCCVSSDSGAAELVLFHLISEPPHSFGSTCKLKVDNPTILGKEYFWPKTCLFIRSHALTDQSPPRQRENYLTEQA